MKGRKNPWPVFVSTTAPFMELAEEQCFQSLKRRDEGDDDDAAADATSAAAAAAFPLLLSKLQMGKRWAEHDDGKGELKSRKRKKGAE